MELNDIRLIKYLELSITIYATILKTESCVLCSYIYVCISHRFEVFTTVTSLPSITWLVSLIEAYCVLSELRNEGVVWIQMVSPCDICGEKCVTETAISPSTLGFPSQYHSIHAPYFYFILKLLLPGGRKDEATEN
jgi:hypothetical protein